LQKYLKGKKTNTKLIKTTKEKENIGKTWRGKEKKRKEATQPKEL